MPTFIRAENTDDPDGRPPFPARSRDRPSRPAGAGSTCRGAALHPRRHRDRGTSRAAADRGARSRRDGPRRRVHDLQLPHLRDDRRRRTRERCRTIEPAARLAAQALWLSLSIGIALLVVAEATAEPLLRALGGHGRSGHYALVSFRIGALGLPAALIALAGQGYLRGVSNPRRPLEIVVGANVANLVLEIVFVYA